MRLLETRLSLVVVLMRLEGATESFHQQSVVAVPVLPAKTRTHECWVVQQTQFIDRAEHELAKALPLWPLRQDRTLRIER